jgi:hypothetical protein
MYQVSNFFYFVTKLYMFWASSVPIIRSYQLYTWQLVCFMQVMWSLQRPHNLHETRVHEDYYAAWSLEHKVGK